MRVLFFEAGECGGSVWSLSNILKGLRPLVREVGLVTHYRHTGPVNLSSLDCVRFWACLDLPPKVRPRPETVTRTFRIPHPTAFAFRYFVATLRALQRFQPDIVYLNNDIEDHIPAVTAAKLLGIPVVCHWRMANHLLPSEKAFAKLIDKLIVLTKAHQEIVKADGIPSEKIVQLYNPCDGAEFDSQSTKELTAPVRDDGSVYVVQTGALNERKRPGLAIDAFVLAKSKCPNLKLILAGDGPARAELVERVELEGLGESVMVIGYCSQIPSLLRHCHIGLLVARTEGFPNCVVEYMLGRLPVVSTKMTAIDELVVDQHNGFVIPEASAPMIAEAMIKLYRSPELRRQMGNAGRLFVTDERFGRERHIQTIYGMLRQVVNKKEPVGVDSNAQAG